MKTLVVGGTGGVGAYVAMTLRDEHGHDVTVAARKTPAAHSPVKGFPMLIGDYVEGTITTDQLAGFDALVFSAAADTRAIPNGASDAEAAAIWHRANSEQVPTFFRLAKEAGIRRTAYIGSFYPQARPDLVDGNAYIRSRKMADEGARALADETFHVASTNPPWIVGNAPGLGHGLFGVLASWALGDIEAPLEVPSGGTNYMALKSVYESTVGALMNGENGRGYLTGGANLRYRDLVQYFFDKVGRKETIGVNDDAPHPFFGDGSLYAGRSGTIFYEAEGTEDLGYDPDDVWPAFDAIIADVRAQHDAKAKA